MKMTYEEAVERVISLTRMAQGAGGTPQEAAVAAATAQKIMDLYNIELAAASIDDPGATPDEAIKDFGSDPLNPGTPVIATWRWRLFLCLGKQNRCRGYRSHLGGIGIVGRPTDVNALRLLFTWLCREVDRLAKRDCVGNGRTYSNNFRVGVVDTIDERLTAQHAETVEEVRTEAAHSANPFALIRVNSAIAKLEAQNVAVGEWVVAHLSLGKGRTRRIVTDYTARAAGREAGYSVQLAVPKVTIGSRRQQQFAN